MRIAVTIPRQLARAAKDAANRRHQTRSEWIRQAIIAALKAEAAK